MSRSLILTGALRVVFIVQLPPLTFCSSGSVARRRVDGVGGCASSVYTTTTFSPQFVDLVLSSEAFGVMPRGSPPLRFVSAGRRWVVLLLLLSVLRRLEAEGNGAAPASPISPQNKLVGEGFVGAALFCSSSHRAGRHGGEGSWVAGGATAARGGRQDLRSICAGSTVAGGFGQLRLCGGPWRTNCCNGSVQMGLISHAAGMNHLSSARLGAPFPVFVGLGGMETGIVGAEIWELGVGSAGTKQHYSRNQFIVVSFGCCDFQSAGAGSSYGISCYLSSGHALHQMRTIGHDDYAFLLFGTCRRRVRASLQRFLRFNSNEPPDLSSVMDILDLQLKLLPHMHLSTRLLVELLVLRLMRLREAPEEYDCRMFVFEFSTNPLGRLRLCSSA